MRFSWKILFSTILIMAVVFGISGYYLIDYMFEASLEREISQAQDDSSILQYAFESAALNIPSKYDVLQDHTIEQIGENLENSGGRERQIRITDEDYETLYVSINFPEDKELLKSIDEETSAYQIILANGEYYVHTCAGFSAVNRSLALETLRNITDIYEERAQSFSLYRRVMIVMLLCCSLVMTVIAQLLTRPVCLLKQAARQMSNGDYSYRAKRISNDEMGQLTTDFNAMADTLETTIRQLEDEVAARETFIGAFSHELKTPLTSIIGYADLLRSRRLDEEKHFRAANYIYTEGKRLESMALRLLDITVVRRSELETKAVPSSCFAEYLQAGSNVGYLAGRELSCMLENAEITCEENLIKTVLVNLIDNACKATEPGSRIEVTGESLAEGYRFSVRDYGKGIPEEELRRITEAFYMVDKSRAREGGGAGLGLALCTEILTLHHSRLEIESTLGEGSCFAFVLPKS